MSTHAVASDTDSTGVQLGESSKDSLGQFLGDIAVHVVALVVWGLGSIDVETSTGSKVISIILTLNVKTT